MPRLNHRDTEGTEKGYSRESAGQMDFAYAVRRQIWNRGLPSERLEPAF